MDSPSSRHNDRKRTTKRKPTITTKCHSKYENCKPSTNKNLKLLLEKT